MVRPHHPRHPLAAWLAAGACVLPASGCATVADDTVSLYGYLFTAVVLDDTATVLTGAHVDGYDLDGVLLGQGYEAFSDSPGYYRVPNLPPRSPVVVVSSFGSDHVPTALRGGTRDVALFLDNGELYVLTAEWVDTWVDAWRRQMPERTPPQVRDPDVEGNGGMVVGQIAEPASWVGTLVQARGTDGAWRPAAYFAESGLPDPEAPSLTADGRFAVFGLPAGPVEVSFTLPGDGEPMDDTFRTLVPEDGVASLWGFRLVEP